MPVRGHRRLLAPSAALAALAFVTAGCGRNPDYPADLTFPPRGDRLVLRLPTAAPPRAGEVGKLDAELAALDAAGGRTVETAALPAVARDELDGFLRDAFGTPAAPRVPDDTGAAGRLGLTAERLAEGGRLYRRHCLQCHGLPGDGRGPTGPWIDPHPRDFRRGAFKFVSTGDGMKPRRADLLRTLREGLRGTAMPAFGLLPDESREVMAAFVVYLSVRGQVEFQTLAALADEATGEGGTEGDLPRFARARLAAILADWEKAEATPAVAAAPFPDDVGRQLGEYLASVARGHDLFIAESGAGCMKCHENYGRTAALKYDVWGTVVRPPDLTTTKPKAGDRAEDLTARVRHGIAPVGMPAHPVLTADQLTDVVRFVRALPYPRELPPEVRAKVYPE
jgi:mono/diheme cytochrome c family protein